MKITSVQFHDVHRTFAVNFDDNMCVILDNDLNMHNMLSQGLSSYFMVKGKWPKGKNLEKRVELGQQWIMKNKNRYKKWPNSSAHGIIKG